VNVIEVVCKKDPEAITLFVSIEFHKRAYSGCNLASSSPLLLSRRNSSPKRSLSAIEEPAAIARILTHLGLAAQPPPRAPAVRVDLFEAA
jgi:hypothetical protein